MIHLGDITKISGRDVPVVDVVIGGSPCQDLSVAGKRAGLAGARSGLFMEQVRIVKEMREEDIRAGIPAFLVRPRFMLWENVPGAFSSNKGEDFRAVLEEIIRIAEPDAPDIPLPDKGRWPMADAWYGDGWSVAYRVFDAQFWGTPQRRRRIALVADFGGHAAPEILFNRQSVCGDSEQSETAREEDAAGTGGGAGETVYCLQGNTVDRNTGQNGTGIVKDVAYTLDAVDRHAVAFHLTQDPITSEDCSPCLSSGNPKNGQATVGVMLYENHGQDSRPTGPLDVAPTVAQKFGTGGNNTPLVVQERAFGVDCRNATEHEELNGTIQAKPNGGFSLNLNQTVRVERTVMGFKYHQGAKANGMGVQEEVAPTLNADGGHPPAICMATGQSNAEIMHDLSTTLNCNHEQPIVMGGCLTPWDSQTHRIFGKEGTFATLSANTGKAGMNRQGVFVDSFVRRLTPMECERLQGYPDGWTDIGPWTDSKGKLHKESSDSARYKALGNSIALPSWKWVLKRLCGCYERDATMASLFDGIGGFPLLWEQINGRGTCLWASEIEEFPIAVTKRRFGE